MGRSFDEGPKGIFGGAQFTLGRCALGDVGEGDKELRDLPALASEALAGELDGKSPGLADATEGDLANSGADPGASIAQMTEKGVAIGGEDEFGEEMFDEFGARMAEQPAGFLIGGENAAMGVGGDEANGGFFEELFEVFGPGEVFGGLYLEPLVVESLLADAGFEFEQTIAPVGRGVGRAGAG
jgi:hypothetical protein